MHVEKISFKNLRNLHDFTLEINKGINILHGDNAQGKTNLIESIYFCATGRSHRTHLYKDMIKFGEKEAYIKAYINDDGIIDTISSHLKKDISKGIAINNIPIKKLGELFGTLLVVIFSPEDLQLIKSGPSERRKFMDIELCQLNSVYYYELKQYHNVLKQRNVLLKKLRKERDAEKTLFIWNEQLVSHGIKIMNYRRDFIEKIDEIAGKLHTNITNEREALNVVYRPNTTENDFLAKLNKNLERDILQGSTSIGIHKDDLDMLINNVDARVYGSQGQQRTASLAIKLSQIEIIYQEKNTYPILLLDDVLSELDESRQAFLVSQLKYIQTIITCTGTEDILKKISSTEAVNIYKVENGKISSESF